MRVLGYTWAGVRTADLNSAARFFTDALGLSLIHRAEGMVQFELPPANCSKSSVPRTVTIISTRRPEGTGIAGSRIRH